MDLEKSEWGKALLESHKEVMRIRAEEQRRQEELDQARAEAEVLRNRRNEIFQIIDEELMKDEPIGKLVLFKLNDHQTEDGPIKLKLAAERINYSPCLAYGLSLRTFNKVDDPDFLGNDHFLAYRVDPRIFPHDEFDVPPNEGLVGMTRSKISDYTEDDFLAGDRVEFIREAVKESSHILMELL